MRPTVASLSFGLVTIHVKLYTAAHSRSVSFHLSMRRMTREESHSHEMK
jgi:non-homologous end joining protein Ku